jgi:glycine betaine/proline transport system permease protein
VPLTAATSLLATGLLSGEGSAAVQMLPPLPWMAVLLAAAILAFHAGGAGLAALARRPSSTLPRSASGRAQW